MAGLALRVLPGRLAVCRLDADAPVPSWAWSGPLASATRTAGELSIVCSEAAVPKVVQQEGGWNALAVVGPLAFEDVGLLSALAAPLARAGLSIFVISTFDTDYLLVRAEKLDEAIGVLRGAGHRVDQPDR